MRFAEGKKRPSTAVKRVATKRLSVDHRGRVLYRYKQPFSDGSTHVVLEPLDFSPNFDQQYLLESGNSWLIFPIRDSNMVAQNGNTKPPSLMVNRRLAA